MNKATIKVLIAMLLWGSLGVFVKNISLDSVEIAFFRGIIGSVFLGIVLLIRMQNNKVISRRYTWYSSRCSDRSAVLTVLLCGIPQADDAADEAGYLERTG